MQALILGDDHRQQARLAAAMMKTGFQVFCVESAAAAASYIRNELIDVLVLTETRSGRIGQSCACVDHSRNRAVSVIVISDRTGPAMEELFEDVPQLYGVMGLGMAPGMVAALALASVLPQQTSAQERPQPQPQVQAAAPAALPVQAATPVVAPLLASLAERLIPVASIVGQGATLSRTLIEPLRRGPVAAPAVPVLKPAGETLAPPVSVQPMVAALPPVLPDAKAAVPPVAALGPRWTNTTLSDVSDISADLAALERELELVNRDRPSVLASSITDPVPRWSQPAPKLAALTDWSIGTPASTDTNPKVVLSSDTAAAKGRADRRLELGETLQ